MTINRYISTVFRGKNFLRLYPGFSDVEASFEIDEIMEWSSDFIATYSFLVPGLTANAKERE